MVQVYLKKLRATVISKLSGKSSALLLYRALFAGMLFFSIFVKAQESEVERLSGFKKFKNDSRIYESEREKGYAAYLESLEKEAFDKKKSLEEYKKTKRMEKPLEETKYYQEYLRNRINEQKEYEQSIAEFFKEKKKWSAKKYDRPFSEEYELGLLEDRPRYNYKKRALYGAKPKYKSAGPSGTGSAGGPSPGYSPPTDFGGDSGYIPPPPPSPPMEPFLDEIPPPPMPMDGTGDFNNDGFIPPPPPPPPMFDGEF